MYRQPDLFLCVYVCAHIGPYVYRKCTVYLYTHCSWCVWLCCAGLWMFVEIWLQRLQSCSVLSHADNLNRGQKQNNKVSTLTERINQLQNGRLHLRPDDHLETWDGCDPVRISFTEHSTRWFPVYRSYQLKHIVSMTSLIKEFSRIHKNWTNAFRCVVCSWTG